MDISYYYQILDVGINYEKGRKKGKFWKLGERKRLREEIMFWQDILRYVLDKEKGIQCENELFERLGILCRKYELPNYERILGEKAELLNSQHVSEVNKEEALKVHCFMTRLLQDMLEELENHKGKEMVYRLMTVLHNFPKVLYGYNDINGRSNSVSYKDALIYAKGYMNESMREKYGEYLRILS